MDINWKELGAWAPLLRSEEKKPYFEKLISCVQKAYRAGQALPPRENLFAAFRLTPPQKVKVVLLGQDPYHEPGQAMGLSFSVPVGVKLPPSLRNVFSEMENDLDIPAPVSGDLSHWAEEGVLLLNTTLTTKPGEAGAHRHFGWQHFTGAVIEATNTFPQPIVFLLWGKDAWNRASVIESSAPREILRAPHPSPLSAWRGFFGSRPFSRANAFLEANGSAPIDWDLS